MTLQQAEDLFREYQALIADDSTRGTRRNPSILPVPKSQIMAAIKLLVAQLYCIGADDKLRLEPLMRAAMTLDSFNDMPLGATEFIVAMQNRRQEIENFRKELLSIRPNHPFFWQQVYPLAGIDTQTKRTTFFESIRERLSMRSKAPEDEVKESLSHDYASGRYDID